MASFRRPLLALGLGMLLSGSALMGFESWMQSTEAAAIPLIKDPDCLQYGVDDTPTNKGRGWHKGAQPPEKARSTTRIVVVGDSVTFGLGLDADEAWPRHLGGWLRVQMGEKNLELFNFGTNSYDARQIACLVTHKVADWDPDLVIYGAYNNDDVPTYVMYSLGLSSPIFTAPQVPDPMRLLPRPLSDLAIRHSATWRRVQGSRAVRILQERDQVKPYEQGLLAKGAAEMLAWSEETGVPLMAVALPPHVLADPERCKAAAGAAWSCELMAQRHEALLSTLAASGMETHDLLPNLQQSGQASFFMESHKLDPDHPNRAGQVNFATGALPLVQEKLGLPKVPASELMAGASAARKPPRKSSRDTKKP